MEGKFYEFDYSKDNSTTKERSEMIYKIFLHSEKVKNHAESCNEKICEVCIKIDFLARVFVYNQKLDNKEIDLKKIFEDEKEIVDEYFFTNNILAPIAISLGVTK